MRLTSYSANDIVTSARPKTVGEFLLINIPPRNLIYRCSWVVSVSMALSREKKEKILKDTVSLLNENDTVVFVSFAGLSAEADTAARTKLYKEGSAYTVIKKTLLKRALDEAGMKGEMPAIEKELAIVYGGDDSMVPARTIKKLAKNKEYSYVIQGGVFEGEFVDKKTMDTIASIPSREELYARMLFMMRAPLQKLVLVLSAYKDALPQK